MREPKQLLLDSRKFAKEDRARSWRVLWGAVGLYAVLAVICAIDLPLWVRIPASVLLGLTLVRLFIIYHDYQHQTILKGSRVAWAVMTIYGLLALNPPRIWARSHNHHHKNNAKIFGASIGSFPVMTTGAWDRAGRGQRLEYLVERHPLTIGLGYATIFLYGMCLRSLIHNPREHWDSGVSLVLHAAMLVGLAYIGWDALILIAILPFTLGSAIGAYLFYAQHNYPAMKIRDRADWDYVFAALHSSSYIPMSPFMAFFTGNIGYHHVHHLNHKIPFYRLPEAMAELEELQSPGRTTLWPWDVYKCLRLKLWDARRDKLITLAEHRANLAADPAGEAAVAAAAVPDLIDIHHHDHDHDHDDDDDDLVAEHETEIIIPARTADAHA